MRSGGNVTRTVILVIPVVLVVAVISGWYVLTNFPHHWRVVGVAEIVLRPLLTPAYAGAGGPASELLLCDPTALELHTNGSVLITDRGGKLRGRIVWEITPDGVARPVAGTGLRGSPIQGLASELELGTPDGIAVRKDGEILISDGVNHVVIAVARDGTARRIVGSGAPGFFGDGGLADLAKLSRPAGIALDSRGALYVADVRNHSIRRIDPDGSITTVAGTGSAGFSPDGTAAVHAQLREPWGVRHR